MEKAANPWTLPVAVDDISEGGLHMKIEAPEGARAELAKVANLRNLPKLSAVFDLTRNGAGVHVAGEVQARIGQTCVVTLEPMESEIREPIDLRFVPVPDGTKVQERRPRQAKPDEDEPPEPLVGGRIDLGALASEFLILGIDPYPRKAGAEFAAPAVEDAGEHPFAALETLKKRLGGGPS